MNTPLSVVIAMELSATLRCSVRLSRSPSASSESFAPAQVNPALAVIMESACM